MTNTLEQPMIATAATPATTTRATTLLEKQPPQPSHAQKIAHGMATSASDYLARPHTR